MKTVSSVSTLFALLFCAEFAPVKAAEKTPETDELAVYIYCNAGLTLEKFRALKMEVRKNGDADIFLWVYHEPEPTSRWDKLVSGKFTPDEMKRLETAIDAIDFTETEPPITDFETWKKQGSDTKKQQEEINLLLKVSQAKMRGIDTEGPNESIAISVRGKRVGFKEMQIATVAKRIPEYEPIRKLNELINELATVVDRIVGKNEVVGSIRDRRKPFEEEKKE
ncbi:MAG TPA: hypothetical protein VKX17_00100 [Planctomycetota bacterium]|nr:hypothetical protein [Planctomycetota bacterium]